MLDPRFLDEIISEHTADSLRDILRRYDLAPINRSYLIAALYYMEGTDNV